MQERKGDDAIADHCAKDAAALELLDQRSGPGAHAVGTLACHDGRRSRPECEKEADMLRTTALLFVAVRSGRARKLVEFIGEQMQRAAYMFTSH